MYQLKDGDFNIPAGTKECQASLSTAQPHQGGDNTLYPASIPRSVLSIVRNCLGARGHPHPAIPGKGSIHWSFPGITFPDNFNAICTLEPGSLKQLDPGWELQSIFVFTSVFQRYQSSAPSTLHTRLARGSHVELLSPGAQHLSENQPVEERDGNEELRQSHPTEACISICLSHTGKKKKNHHQKVRPPAPPCSTVDVSIPPNRW